MDAQPDTHRLDEAEMGDPVPRPDDEWELESFPASDPPSGWAGPDAAPETSDPDTAELPGAAGRHGGADDEPGTGDHPFDGAGRPVTEERAASNRAVDPPA